MNTKFMITLATCMTVSALSADSIFEWKLTKENSKPTSTTIRPEKLEINDAGNQIIYVKVPRKDKSGIYFGKIQAAPEKYTASNFSFTAKVRVTGKNGHIYLFGLGAGSGGEGFRVGIELRNRTVIPYVNLNFETPDLKNPIRYSIAAKDNEMKVDEWTEIAVTVDRSKRMTLYIDGLAAANCEISKHKDIPFHAFAKYGASITSSETGSYMQYQPLILKDVPYDAEADISSIIITDTVLSSSELKKQ